MKRKEPLETDQQMEHHPLFSVIIPTYNRGRILSSTLDSVLKQSFENWECIIIDDGSTDNTQTFIKGYLEDPRFTYHYQNNAERSAARNKGIDIAKGKYLCFLDSDDLFLKDHLSELANQISTESTPHLFFTNGIVDKNGSKKKVSFPTYDKSADYFIVNSVIPARVCIDRAILEKFRFDPEIVIVEDSVLWTEIHLEYPVKHLELDTIVYRWHGGNSVNLENNSFLPRLKGLRRLFSKQKVKERISLQQRNAALSNCYYGIAKYYKIKRKWLAMCFNIVRSILLDPKSKQTKTKIYMVYEFFR